MLDQTFKNLCGCLSLERISAYRTHSCRTNADAVARYSWNVALCEAFYPVLSALEVGLRNGTDRALVIKHGKHWLQRDLVGLDKYQLDKLENAKAELTKQNRPHDHGRLVAELPFGFWTALYNRKQEHLWHGILKHAVPHLGGTMRTRSTIANRLDSVRWFRNRVFHHERIIHHPFMRIHGEILETIGWLSDDLHRLASAFDRVPAVNAAGPSAFDHILAVTFPLPAIQGEAQCQPASADDAGVAQPSA